MQTYRERLAPVRGRPRSYGGRAGYPLSRFSGAIPTSAAICLRFKCPSSGQFGQERKCYDRTDARHAAQQLLVLAPYPGCSWSFCFRSASQIRQFLFQPMMCACMRSANAGSAVLNRLPSSRKHFTT